MLNEDEDTSEPNPAAVHVGSNELISYVERIERVNEEMEGLQEDRKEIFGEAKASGFDTAVLRKVIARRKDPDKTRNIDDLIDTYENAIAGH
jgi:uncharacterized protein (UPF0335 family)